MLVETAIVILAAALAMFQTAFLSAWPTGWIINPALVLTMGLVAAFRFRSALVVAAVAGATTDIVVSTVIGPHVAAYLVTALVAIWLFTRVLTNATLASFLAINAVAFVTYALLCAGGGAFADSLLTGVGSGGPWLTWAVVRALACQLVLAALSLAAGRAVRRSFAARFLFPEHAS